jgi:hypothetical protein
MTEALTKAQERMPVDLRKLPNFRPDLRLGGDPDETEGRAIYRGRAQMQANSTSRKAKLRAALATKENSNG